jgi:hypothetical protein
VLAASNGLLPWEEQGVKKKEAGAAQAAAAAAALSDIPGAAAQWDEVASFMRRVRADMVAGNMQAWVDNDMQRGKAVDRLCGSWMEKAACKKVMKKELQSFWVQFKAACQKAV